MTLRDLSAKDVIQLKTGENLGRIDDVVFDEHGGQLQSVILRGRAHCFGLLGCDDDLILPDVMDELRQREWFSLFDGGIASCDVHLCKPEPEIFTTLMQTCHLAYDESIFVDDNKANAQAAYNLGITGILYKNPKSFTRALGACGIEVE